MDLRRVGIILGIILLLGAGGFAGYYYLWDIIFPPKVEPVVEVVTERVTEPVTETTTEEPADPFIEGFIGGSTYAITSVRDVQVYLNSINYDCGEVDGTLNSQTVEQIRAYQRDNGLTENGEVTEELLAFIRAGIRVQEVKKPKLRVHVIDVGQGLCVLLESDGKYALYDAGPKSSEEKIEAYLKEQGVKKLTYVIASHYEEEVVGALPGILESFDAETVLGPDYVGPDEAYDAFMDAVENKGKTVESPSPGDKFTLGDASLKLLAPRFSYYDKDNDYSLVFRVKASGCSLLLTGAAGKESEEEMVSRYGKELKSDILFISNFGDKASTKKKFLSRVSPDIAVISCGYENEEGYPSSTVVNRLQSEGISLYRTDEQGSFVLSVKSKSWYASAGPCNIYSPGHKPGETLAPTSTPAAGETQKPQTKAKSTGARTQGKAKTNEE